MIGIIADLEQGDNSLNISSNEQRTTKHSHAHALNLNLHDSFQMSDQSLFIPRIASEN